MLSINTNVLNKTFLLKHSVILVTLSMYAGIAQAEVSQPRAVIELEPTVVTATKTERPISKVTAAVTVIDQAQIENMGAATLKDIFTKTPALTIQYGTFPSGSSASKSSVSIRGMGATGSLWLLDGRRLAGEVKNPYDMERLPASMIERIEIVKGPMSALYGADAIGGVINIITKQPKDGFSGQVSLTGGANLDGDGGNNVLSASVQGRAGRFFGSLYASASRAEPYSETERTNTRIGSGRHAPEDGIPPMPGFLNPKSPTGGKPFYVQADGSVKPKPLDASKLNSDIAAVKSDFNRFKSQASGNIKNHYIVPVSYREEAEVDTLGGRAEFDVTEALTVGAAFNWFQETRDGVYRGTFHPMAYMPPLGSKANPIAGYDAAGNAKGKRMGAIPAFDVPVNSHDDNERLDLSIDANYQVNEALDVTMRVYRSDYEKRNTTTMNQFKNFGFPSEAKSASNGMNANVDITAYELSSNWQASDNHLLTAGVEYRDEEREATVFSQSQGFDTRRVSYLATYLQDDVNLTEDITLTLGGRYDKYSQDAYIDSLGNQRDDSHDSKATFRAGVVKTLPNHMRVRANIAQGYRVPDIRELFIQKQTPAGMQLGANTIDPRFGKTAYELHPETTTSYELGIGMSGGTQNQVNLELNTFYNTIEDRITQVSKQASSGGSYYTFENVADAETYGAELALGYQLTDSLGATLNWTELRTKNKDTGQDLEFNPERTLAAGLNWQPTDRLNLGANAKHIGKQSYLDAGQMRKTDAYTLVNVNAGYDFGANKQTQVFAGVNNIFDEEVDKRLGSDVGTYVYAGVRQDF